MDEFNVLFLIGASGSGKSSLVRAGLIPSLEAEGNWLILPPIKPGDSALMPIMEISRVLAQSCSKSSTKRAVSQAIISGNVEKAINFIPGQTQILLIVDQFEEIFTVCPEDKEIERQQFIDLLVNISNYSDLRLRVVMTMRADFFEECLRYRVLGEVMQQRQLLLLPMNEQELQEAIELPAIIGQCRLSEGLLLSILRDIRQEKNFLPLLEFTMTQLWQRRENNLLTLTAYDDLGGVLGALNQQAEDIYQKLSDHEKNWTQRLFLKLVRTGRGEKDTRQRQLKRELLQLAVENERLILNNILEELIDERLLVTEMDEKGLPWIDLAHEALMDSWQRFSEWRQDDRDLRRLVDRIEDAYGEWDEKGNMEDYLMSYGLMLEAQGAWENIKNELSIAAQNYYQKSSQNAISQECQKRLLATGEMLALSQSQFLLSQQLEAILAAIKAGEQLLAIKSLEGVSEELETRVVFALRQSIYGTFERNRLEGHSGRIFAMAFSNRGDIIASAGSDCTVRLWTKCGRLIRSMEGHSDRVLSVVFDQSDEILASSSGDGSIRLWNREGETIKKFHKAHNDRILSLCFNPNSNILASSSADGHIKLWNVEGELLGDLEGHIGDVNRISFSADGALLASCGSDKSVRIWLVSDATTISTCFGHLESVTAVCFSPDGKHVFSASEDRTVKIWNLAGEEVSRLCGHSDWIRDVSFSPDGKIIATASSDRTIKIWSSNSFSEILTLPGHSASIWVAQFSPDGQTLGTASADGTIRLWNINTPLIATIEGHDDWVWSVRFSPDGKMIASSGDDKLIKLWNLEGKEIRSAAIHSRSVSSVSFLANQPFLLSASEDKSICILSLDTFQVVSTEMHNDAVLSICNSADGKFIASASADGVAKIWSYENLLLSKILEFHNHNSSIRRIVFNSSNQNIASASEDKKIFIWNINGDINSILQGHSDRVFDICFSPNGKTLASASADTNVILWDLEEAIPKQTCVLTGHKAGVRVVCFSPCGNFIASGGEDNSIIIWNIEGTEVIALLGHQNWVLSLCFNPDGSVLASASADKTIKLWDTSSLLDPARETQTASTLERFIVQGKDLIKEYLRNNIHVNPIDRKLIDENKVS